MSTNRKVAGLYKEITIKLDRAQNLLPIALKSHKLHPENILDWEERYKEVIVAVEGIADISGVLDLERLVTITESLSQLINYQNMDVYSLEFKMEITHVKLIDLTSFIDPQSLFLNVLDSMMEQIMSIIANYWMVIKSAYEQKEGDGEYTPII